MKITHHKHVSIDDARMHYANLLDEKVDELRDSYYAKGFWIVEEYRLAVEEALDFKKRNYTGTAPPTVASYAQASSVSVQIATDNILTTKEATDRMLIYTRHIRLTGKSIISNAASVAQIRAAYQAAVEALSNLVLPVPTPL